MSERWSFSSNHRGFSQPRKISIGLLVDSISKEEKIYIKDAVTQIAENATSNKGKCVKDSEGHTTLFEEHATVPQKDTSPWFCTTSFNPKISSSVAVHNTENALSFHATSRIYPRLKLLEKASAANSPQFLGGNAGLESDECRQKNVDKTAHSTDAVKLNNAEHVKNMEFSNEPGVVVGKKWEQDKDRKTETAGNETLRMKLWEILGNVSSPNKHCPSPQFELYPHGDRNEKHSPVEKRNLNFEKIENYSEKHAFRRPVTRSLTQKRTSTKNQQNKIEATESTCHRKECLQKRIFSLKEDRSGRLNDNFNDCSLPSKRNKIEKQSSGPEGHQGHRTENAEEKQKSEDKSRSIPVVEKSMVHRHELVNANSSYDRRNDAFVEPESGMKNNDSVESPPSMIIEQQKDAEKLVGVEISKLMDQLEVKANTLLKNRGNHVQDPLTPTFEINSPDCLLKSKRGKLLGQIPVKNKFSMKGIQSVKSLSSSKSSEGKPNVQEELSDDRCELNGSLHIQPIMKDNNENQMTKSSADSMDADNMEYDSDMKGCRESEKLSLEYCTDQKFLHRTDETLDVEKDVEVNGCSPESKSFKGIQDSREFQMYLEQNHEDALASAVALFAVALRQIKTKLKSLSNQRSAEILWAAAKEITLLFQNAESQIKSDVAKLAHFIQSERKRIESRFQVQQEKLLGIYKRFKEEVDRHLQDNGGIIEDLDEHEIKLKRTMEKQRLTHKKFLSQLEEELKVQLDDADNRIMAVQELAKEKMLQLKLVVAESVKHDAFG